MSFSFALSAVSAEPPESYLFLLESLPVDCDVLSGRDTLADVPLVDGAAPVLLVVWLLPAAVLVLELAPAAVVDGPEGDVFNTLGGMVGCAGRCMLADGRARGDVWPSTTEQVAFWP